MNRLFLNGALYVLVALLLVACATPQQTVAKKDYEAFRAENPRSILIVPAINKSVEIDAPDYFLSTIAAPIAERGYYVFPVFMVQQILNDDGLSDADLVHESDPVILANLFGADAVLYVSIERWEAAYAVLSTQVTVELRYVLKSGKTGQELWQNQRTHTYSTGNNYNTGGGLVGLLAQVVVNSIEAAVERASPRYIPLAKQANTFSVYWSGQGLPAGPYDALYLQDKDAF